MKQLSNIITFPGRPHQKVTEERIKKRAQKVAFVKEYGPTALFAILWVIFILITNIYFTGYIL